MSIKYEIEYIYYIHILEYIINTLLIKHYIHLLEEEKDNNQ